LNCIEHHQNYYAKLQECIRAKDTLGLVDQSMIKCSICKVISNRIEEFEKHLIGEHEMLYGNAKIVHYIAYLEQRITVLDD
jgi:hypothetical protein